MNCKSVSQKSKKFNVSKGPQKLEYLCSFYLVFIKSNKNFLKYLFTSTLNNVENSGMIKVFLIFLKVRNLYDILLLSEKASTTWFTWVYISTCIE